MSDLFLNLAHLLLPAIRPLDRLVGHSIDTIGDFAYSNIRTPLFSLLDLSNWACDAIDAFFVWLIWGGTVIQGFTIPLLLICAAFLFAQAVTSDHVPARIVKFGRIALVALFIFSYLLLISEFRVGITTPAKFKRPFPPEVNEAPSLGVSPVDSIFADPPQKCSSWRNDLLVKQEDLLNDLWVKEQDFSNYIWGKQQDISNYLWVKQKDLLNWAKQTHLLTYLWAKQQAVLFRFLGCYYDYQLFLFKNGLYDAGVKPISTEIDKFWIMLLLGNFAFGTYYYLQPLYLPPSRTRLFLVWIGLAIFLYLDLVYYPPPPLLPLRNILYWIIYLLGLDSLPTTPRSLFHCLATIGWSHSDRIFDLDSPLLVLSILSNGFHPIALIMVVYDAAMYLFAHPLPVLLWWWFYAQLSGPELVLACLVLYALRAFLGYLVLFGQYPRELQPWQGGFWQVHRVLAHGAIGIVVGGSVILVVEVVRRMEVVKMLLEGLLTSGGLGLFLDSFGKVGMALAGLVVIAGAVGWFL